MQNCLAQSDNIADFFLNFQLLLKIEKVFSCTVLPYFLYMLCRSRSHEKLTHATPFLQRSLSSLYHHLQQREISFPDLWIFQEALFGFIFHCHACNGLKRAFSAPCWGSFNVQHFFFHLQDPPSRMGDCLLKCCFISILCNCYLTRLTDFARKVQQYIDKYPSCGQFWQFLQNCILSSACQQIKGFIWMISPQTSQLGD